MARGKTAQTDPLQGALAYRAFDAAPSSGKVKLEGDALADGALVALLKSEWLAANAGATPWVPLPGGGKGVLEIGGALAAKADAWPPGARQLYLAQHRTWSAIHASVTKARSSTPLLTMPEDILGQGTISNFASNQMTGQMAGLGPLIVLGVVGIAAIISGAWYVTRTEQTMIETNADYLKHVAKLGQISDLASKQLAETGKIDPQLVAAGNEGTPDMPTGPNAALWLGIGAAAVVAVGGGAVYYTEVLRKKKR
jgi:hypothetical protein